MSWRHYTSWMATSYPALIKLLAIRAPMFPSPMNPILCFASIIEKLSIDWDHIRKSNYVSKNNHIHQKLAKETMQAYYKTAHIQQPNKRKQKTKKERKKEKGASSSSDSLSRIDRHIRVELFSKVWSPFYFFFLFLSKIYIKSISKKCIIKVREHRTEPQP